MAAKFFMKVLVQPAERSGCGVRMGKPDRSPANQNVRFSGKPDREKIKRVIFNGEMLNNDIVVGPLTIELTPKCALFQVM